MTVSNLSMVTVQHKMVGLERMSDYRGFTAYPQHSPQIEVYCKVVLCSRLEVYCIIL